jgi:hypothetical protein
LCCASPSLTRDALLPRWTPDTPTGSVRLPTPPTDCTHWPVQRISNLFHMSIFVEKSVIAEQVKKKSSFNAIQHSLYYSQKPAISLSMGNIIPSHFYKICFNANCFVSFEKWKPLLGRVVERIKSAYLETLTYLDQLKKNKWAVCLFEKGSVLN